MMRAAVFLLSLVLAAATKRVAGQTFYNTPENFFHAANTTSYLEWIGLNAADYIAVHDAGWLGFGLAEAGGMEGADLFYYETSHPDQVTDAYVKDERFPLMDDCQDWELLDSVELDGFLIVQTKRLLSTRDPQDRPIRMDSDTIGHRIIAAWGDSDTMVYHGDRRARGAVQWYRYGVDLESDFEDAMSSEAEGYFELKAVDYSVKPIDTEYVDFCFTWSEIQDQLRASLESFTVIGVQHIIDDDTRQYIHHFTAFGSSEESPQCGEMAGGMELIYAWAPGESAMMTPPNVGIPFGGEDGHRSLRLEIHYNNPELLEGAVDSSGIRLYFTTTPRQYELGGLQLGDPILSLRNQLVNPTPDTPFSQHVFDCPMTCSMLALDEPITVHIESLHMHQSGASMRNELIRRGEVVHVGQVDYFDFDQQGSYMVPQEPFQVYPGDSWKTTCTYRSVDSDTRFGYSSQEEMCIAFLFYYPRKTLRNRMPWMCSRELPVLKSCEATHEVFALTSHDEEHVFGVETDGCNSSTSEGASSAPPNESDDFCLDPCGGTLTSSNYWVHKETLSSRIGSGGQRASRCMEQCAGPVWIDVLKQGLGYSCGRCQE